MNTTPPPPRELAPIYNLRALPPHQEVAVGYLAEYGGNTHNLYRRYLAEWFQWCDHQQINPLDASRAYVALYVRELSERLKASSIGSAMTPIRGYYKYAHLSGFIPNDPAAYVKLPKIHYTKKPFKERHDVRTFLATAKATSPRHWAASQMLCLMGMRNSEVCGITVEQALNKINGVTVITYIGKGGVPTSKAVPIQAQPAIDAAINGRTTGWLITTRDGTKISRNAMYGLMKTVSNRCGIKMNPHYLRASAASILLDSGGSMEEAQRFLNHADMRVTQRHYDLRKDDPSMQPTHFVGARLAV